MIRKLLLTLLLCPLCLWAQDKEELYWQRLNAAVQVEATQTRSLALVDTLSRLSKAPVDMADVSSCTEYAGSKEPEAQALAPALRAIAILQLAAENKQAAYIAAVEKYRALYPSSPYLTEIDVGKATVPCDQCHGVLKCTTCKGSLKCTACKGRGYTRAPASKNSLAAAPRETCKHCNGTGKCPTCNGKRLSCEACRNTGRMPDPKVMTDRLTEIARKLYTHVTELWSADLVAVAESKALHDALKKLQSQRALPRALEALEALDLPQAVQWPEVAVLKADLRDTIAFREDHSAAKELARKNLRTAIQQAQTNPAALSGIAQLLPVMRRHADSDALPEAQRALEALVTASLNDRKQLLAVQREKLRLVKAIVDPEQRIRSLTDSLDTWPNPVIPEEVKTYAKESANEALQALIKGQDLKSLKHEFEDERSTAEAALSKREEEAQKSNKSIWILAGAGLGGLLLLYILFAVIRSTLAQRAEAKRKADERAELNKIRQTFRHKH